PVLADHEPVVRLLPRRPDLEDVRHRVVEGLVVNQQKVPFRVLLHAPGLDHRRAPGQNSLYRVLNVAHPACIARVPSKTRYILLAGRVSRVSVGTASGGSRVVVARPNLRGFRGVTFDGFGALLEGGPHRLPSVFERLFRERGGPVDPIAAEAWRRAVQKQFAAKTFVDRKSTRLNSSHLGISYAVFCLKKKLQYQQPCKFATPSSLRTTFPQIIHFASKAAK